MSGRDRVQADWSQRPPSKFTVRSKGFLRVWLWSPTNRLSEAQACQLPPLPHHKLTQGFTLSLAALKLLVPDLLVLFCLPCTIWFQHSVNRFSFSILRVSDAFSHRSSSFPDFQILWLILLRALGFSSTSATSLPPPHPFLSLPVSPPVPWLERTWEEYAKDPEILLVRKAEFVKFASVKGKATWTALGVSQGKAPGSGLHDSR